MPAISTVETQPSDTIDFDESYYFDTVGRSNQPLQIFIGGRGCGKTFSTLRNCVYDKEAQLIKYPRNEYEDKFIYLRHTQKQVNICAKNVGNPFKRINAKYGLQIMPRKSEDIGIFYDKDTSEFRSESRITGAKQLGYAVALSTFGNMRGNDFSDVDRIVFDEFIDPSSRIKAITRTAGEDFQNLRETIGRNRELEGKPPLSITLLSNSITLDSPILLELGVANIVASMVLANQHKTTIREKGIYIELIEGGKFAEAKAQTSLYKNSREDSLFVQQALRNRFFSDNFNLVRKNAPVNEYIPLCSFNKAFTMYKHKTRLEFFISSKSIQTNCPTYTTYDLDRIVNDWEFAYKAWVIDRKVYFDSYATKLMVDSIIAK